MPENSLEVWNSLNPRQQKYLSCIYEADRNAEDYERGKWSSGISSRPASVWRWLSYSADSYLRDLLKSEKLIDEGSGSTFEALRERKIIECKHEQGFFGSSLLYVKLTTFGRRVARVGLDKPAPKKLPVGTLRDYQWKALVKAYRAGDEGLKDVDELEFYGGIGWKVWLRLRNYKSGALVQEKKTTYKGNADWEYRIFITDFGKQFIQKNWEKYRDLYPEVEAIS